MHSSAYEQLRQDIVSGELAPGTALAEVALAERYGVSRTPIREALRRLEQDGLTERLGRGMRVREHSADEILEIYDVRIILEEAAARRAALARTDLDLTLLAKAHEEMCAVEASSEESGDAELRARTNRTFHERIRTASHNATLVDMLERLEQHLHRYPLTTLTYPGRWSAVLEEHQRLLTAIRERRADDAAEIAAAHMTRARDIRLRMYAQEQ